VQYEILKKQLNPHFLFNSLAALSGLISTEPGVARRFLEKMTKIYRYILKSDKNELVRLSDEINFAATYINLQQTRFGKGLEVNINVDEDFYGRKIVPVTIQNMIENAIKHNVISAASPLVIDITLENDCLVIKNNLQKKLRVETSNKLGLNQLKTLYTYLTDRPVIIEETEKDFAVRIPLV
jgi:LytS/YehU family sensor histidine kinase